MMKPAAASLLALALAASSSLPPRALYHCSVTGKRNQPACCCAPRGGACAQVPCCRATRAGPHPGRTRSAPPGAAFAAAHGLCCSVTHEARDARLLARAALDHAWQSFLECSRDAVSSPAALPPELPRIALRPAPLRPAALPRERAGPPLFILHRALLF